jgi:hypothetical protein
MISEATWIRMARAVAGRERTTFLDPDQGPGQAAEPILAPFPFDSS